MTEHSELPDPNNPPHMEFKPGVIPFPDDYSITINAGHAEKLLKQLGIIPNSEDFPKLKDPSYLSAIEAQFTLAPMDEFPEIMGYIKISADELNETISLDATRSPAEKKLRSDAFFDQVLQQLAQAQFIPGVYIFERYMNPPAGKPPVKREMIEKALDGVAQYEREKLKLTTLDNLITTMKANGNDPFLIKRAEEARAGFGRLDKEPKLF